MNLSENGVYQNPMVSWQSAQPSKSAGSITTGDMTIVHLDGGIESAVLLVITLGNEILDTNERCQISNWDDDCFYCKC